MKRGGYGFTLIELLIVIVVIAILALITVVTYRGITERTYMNRAQSEMSSLARAVKFYHASENSYPDDVERNIPSDLVRLVDIGNSGQDWPTGPWPHSVYDYDNFVGTDGEDAVQISIRFCPAGGPIGDCHFPNEPWASDFQVDSSAYWCITGQCRAHPNQPDDYPGYCVNCKQ